MGFPSDKQDATGKSKKFGNAVAQDERSNKGPTSSSKTIGVVKGRYSFSKTSVAGLNQGVATARGCKDEK